MLHLLKSKNNYLIILILTGLFGWGREGEAEVGSILSIQPPFILLSPASHPVQTYACITENKNHISVSQSQAKQGKNLECYTCWYDKVLYFTDLCLLQFTLIKKSQTMNYK